MNPKELLEEYGLTPKKSLGQNFMHDPNLIEKIVTTANIMPEDTVIEIGPGTGELTEALAQKARHVFAIEVDDRLRPLLETRFENYSNVYFMFEDVLRVDLLRLVGADDFIVVTNVPYYITTAVMQHLLEQVRRPKRIVMTMQYEVAQRIVAGPGDMSVLAASVQYYGEPKIVTRLKPAVFWPRPNVDSAVLCVETYEQPIVDVPGDKEFFRVVKAGFSQKRKQLRNSLAGGLGVKSAAADAYLTAAGIEPKRRAETLSLEEWAALTRAVVATGQLSGER